MVVAEGVGVLVGVGVGELVVGVGEGELVVGVGFGDLLGGGVVTTGDGAGANGSTGSPDSAAVMNAVQTRAGYWPP